MRASTVPEIPSFSTIMTAIACAILKGCDQSDDHHRL
jgi:hypothetical protein